MAVRAVAVMSKPLLDELMNRRKKKTFSETALTAI
jgi:hypothetical protein